MQQGLSRWETGAAGRYVPYAAGEMAFLTGHSGAGKSTLLKRSVGLSGPAPGKSGLAAMTSASEKP